MRTNKLLLIILAILPIFGFSQDGSPDLSFGINGVVQTDIDDGIEIISGVAQSDNGRIIVIGTNIYETEDVKNFIIAFQENGDIDTTFGNDGSIVLEIDTFEFTKVYVQSDGKILVGGEYNQEITFLRFLEDGTEDLSFGVNGVLVPFPTGESYRDLILLNNDKILTSGTASLNGVSQATLKQFLPNGILDNSFGTNGISNIQIGNQSNSVKGKIQLMENGNIILGGRFANSSKIVMRCLPNGSLDTSFGANGYITIPISEENNCFPLVFSDGSILVSCSYFDDDTKEIVKVIIKLSSDDGAMDLNFGNNGYIHANTAELIQHNQRIIMKNSRYWYTDLIFGLRRFYANGNIDFTFQYSPNYGLLINYNFAYQNDGKIIIAGTSFDFLNLNIVLQRFNNDPLGIDDHQLQNFTVFPNPSKGIYNINHDFISSETPYQIADITGKIIQTGKLTGEQTEINLSTVQSGMYLITASGSTFRLIKN